MAIMEKIWKNRRKNNRKNEREYTLTLPSYSNLHLFSSFESPIPLSFSPCLLKCLIDMTRLMDLYTSEASLPPALDTSTYFMKKPWQHPCLPGYIACGFGQVVQLQ